MKMSSVKNVCLGVGIRAAVVAMLIVAGVRAPGGVARAQTPCEPSWLPGAGIAGVSGRVQAMAEWDPDKQGPRGKVIVVGGQFEAAGTNVTRNLALYDRATGEWSALPSDLPLTISAVRALTVDLNGDLVVGGTGTPGVLRWNGTTWISLPGLSASGIEGIGALVTLPNGDIVAGGDLSYSPGPGVRVNGFARWNGSTWSGLGGNGVPTFQVVRALLVLPDGRLVAAGQFNSMSGVPAANIAMWDGQAWSAPGGGIQVPTGGNGLFALAVEADGTLIAGGDIRISSFTFNNVQRLVNGTWTSIWPSSGVFGTIPVVRSMSLLSDGRLVVGGDFTGFSGIPGTGGTALWDGTAWRSMSEGVFNTTTPNVAALLANDDGSVMVGGDFFFAGDGYAERFAQWSESAGWTLPPGGTSGRINSVSILPRGQLVVGGVFSQIDGVRSTSFALFDGRAWRDLSLAVGARSVDATLVLRNGDIVAAGRVSSPGGEVVQVVRREGDTWRRLGEPFGSVSDLLELPNGDLLAVGSFTIVGTENIARVARWDGVRWNPLGIGLGGTNAVARRAAVAPDGSIIVVGTFSSAGGIPVQGIARWNGSVWSPVGSLSSGSFNDVEVLPNSDIYVVGSYRLPGELFNGIGLLRFREEWSPVGGNATFTNSNASVTAMDVLPSGEILVAGRFTNIDGVSLNSIARWDGTGWRALGAGLTVLIGIGNPVSDLAVQQDGTIVAVGSILTAGGRVSRSIARFGCPPCTADFDRNGLVDFFDYLDFVQAFADEDPRADINGNGTIDFFDYLDFVEAFDSGC
jgi:trimeric autotransporter adhesin